MLLSNVLSRLHVGLVPVDEILLRLLISSLSLFLLSLDSVLILLADSPLFLFFVSIALSFFFGLNSGPFSLRLGLQLFSLSLCFQPLSFLGLILESNTLSFGSFSLNSLSLDSCHGSSKSYSSLMNPRCLFIRLCGFPLFKFFLSKQELGCC